MESNTNTAQLKIDENIWVIQINEGLDILQQEEEDFRASVFNVPKELLALKPEAYIPQIVSIGPYHHWRSELYETEGYKLSAVHRFEKRINRRGKGKFQSVVVEEFKKDDWQIRSCYHKFIDYKEETLAWVMSLDAAFLLECLQFYIRHANDTPGAEFKQLGRLLDLSGNSAAHNSIVRDAIMLENQLPLFLLQKLLELQMGSKVKAEETLSGLLRLVCQELSPFTFELPDRSNLYINGRGHVLEVLYYAIVPNVSNNQNPNQSHDEEETESPDTVDSSSIRVAFSTLLWKTLSSLNFRPLRFLSELGGRLRSLRSLNLPVQNDTIQLAEGDGDEEGQGEESVDKIIPPTRYELNIPSVADLHSVGVKFVCTKGDLTTIQFDEKTATLYLPRVKLDTNTEVILRNLVAFEASAATGPLVFTRYIDFMNGIIDSEEDVRLKNGIISNHLKGDVEVASLWNSMGRCVHLTKVEFLDKVIENVNTCYYRKWKIVAVKFVKKHIFGSWQFPSLVAAVILLVVGRLQAFCSAYDCKSLVRPIQSLGRLRTRKLEVCTRIELAVITLSITMDIAHFSMFISIMIANILNLQIVLFNLNFLFNILNISELDCLLWFVWNTSFRQTAILEYLRVEIG